MKVFVRKASGGKGQVKECENLQNCINTLLETEDFDGFAPSVIVKKADNETKNKYGEECEYEITIKDDWIE